MNSAATTGTELTCEKADRYRPLGAFGKPAWQSHVQLRAMLLSRKGPKVANYFAKPTYDPETGLLRWSSEAPGLARPWQDMAPEEQAQRALQLELIRSELMGFASELREQGGSQPGGAAAFASLLDQAVKVPAQGNFLHFVGEQPVIAFWGFENHDGASLEPAAQAPRQGKVAAAAAAPVVVEKRKRPWWWWLLWALLALLLLLGLLLGLRYCATPPPPVPLAPEPVVPKPEPPTPEPVVPKPEPPAPEPVVPEPEPPAPPPPVVEKRPDPPKPPEVKPGEERLVCIRPRRGRMVVVFDTSKSMGFPTDNPDVIAEIERRLAAGDPEGHRRAMELLHAPGRKRIDDARDAALGLVKAMPPNIDVGLVSFGSKGCDVAVDVKPGAPRKDVARALSRMTPRAGTPLAASLRLAMTQLSSDPKVAAAQSIVVITDGGESCGGDPCAAALDLKTAFPSIKVHVIDVAGVPRLQCVADITGGSSVGARDTKQLRAAIRRAQASIERDACR